MKKRSRILALTMALLLSTTALAACGPKQGSSQAPTPQSEVSQPAKEDTVTMLLPPVSANFQKRFDQYAADFKKANSNLTLKIEPASWEDMTQKLDTQVNAGTPPDVAFIGAGGISKYVDQKMLMDIKDVATSEMKSDFDEGPLKYMTNGSGLYGFPAYMEIHCLGGNKQYLEEAGIDWKKVQKSGWTFDEFRAAIKKGVLKDGDSYKHYGFVFACSGVTSKDYLGLLVKNAGMPSAFNDKMKFTYTSKNYLEVLKGVRALIDDGSMPKELSSVDAGKRWNMFLTGQTMITGKGLATFENSANLNNKKIDAKDGSAVKDSIKVDYVVLPVPTFAGQKQQAAAAVDGYVTFRGKSEPTAEHKANVVKAAYFMASGKTAVETNNELFCAHITKSGRDYANTLAKVDRSTENQEAVKTLISQAAPARPDIPTDLGAKAIKLEDEVIVPKFQALLAGEISPDDMYKAVKEAAITAFGKDGVVAD